MAYLGAGITRFNTADGLTVKGTAEFTDTVVLGDSDELRFGAGEDLKIYHDASNSYIHDAGTGALIIRSNSFQAKSADNTTTMFTGAESGAVELYHNNVKRIETTGSGATVTGTVTATSYTGDGSSLTGINTDLSGDTTPQLGGNLDTNGNNINFGDNDKAQFGAGNDLQIYHDGSNSYIKDAGTGNLKIQATNFELESATGENMLLATADGAVSLQYDNATKLATTSTGIGVTGTITADGLTVDTNTLEVDATNNRVGIGTTSPSKELHVKGDIDIEGDTGGVAVLRFKAEETHGTVEGINIGSNYGGLAFKTNSNGTTAERMRIDSAGTVAVGTTDTHSWSTFDGRLHLGARGILATTSGSSQVGYNWYYDGAYKYIAADVAQRYYQSAGNHVWETASSGSADGTITFSEKMRIDSSGNVGIGTSSISGCKLDVAGGIKATDLISRNSGGMSIQTDEGTKRIIVEDGGNVVINETGANADFRVESDTNTHALFVDASYSATVCVGTSDINLHNSNTAGINLGGNGNTGQIIASCSGNRPLILHRSSSNGQIVEFGCQTSTVGGIDVTTSGTTYNTTSDRRLKTDIQPIADATDKLMQMQPVTHKWIADPDADAVHGFIAQDMQQICPEAVSGEDGGEDMMSMDYGRITPVLVAALQDAHRKIKELEQRLSEMEN